MKGFAEMTVLRSLLLPFYPTTLIFVGTSAALLALTGVLPAEAAILRIIPAALLLSWLFKYAYTLLDEAANGSAETPVPSVEMLGPFEARPLLQLFVCAVVYKAVSIAGGSLGTFILLAYLLLLPASIGVLGVTQNLLVALNPAALVRTAWGLGWYYPLILCLIACNGYGIWILYHTSLWSIGLYALVGLAVLSVFSFIGGAIFARRTALGFEPRSSPEHKAAAAEDDRLRRRSRVLDEAYGFIRVHDSRRAVEPLHGWLAGLKPQQLTGDVHAIMAQAAQWNNDRGLAEVTQCVVGNLVKIANVDLALGTLESTLARLPRYALESENDSVALARHAQATGKPQLARTIINNSAARAAPRALGAAATTLLRELQS